MSVEAGMRWAELALLLAAQKQMIPLDPPFFDEATVGGVVAAGAAGPRRRLYGSVRDAVIGMKFATLEGKLVQAGGMVVKNVAGLDMSKLMIGSFGTLAAMAVVNFKLSPQPPETRTFLSRFEKAADALASRDAILQGVLHPAAVDLLNPAAAERVGLHGFCLLLSAGGSPAVMARYGREIGQGTEELDNSIWDRIREFTPAYLRAFPQGGVVRISTTLGGIGKVLQSFEEPVVSRAGTGVSYVYFSEASAARLQGMKGVIEFAPDPVKRSLDLWPAPGSDLR
ncbi:MAG: FAD-binding protein [Bryobacteraceae bacterium]